MLHRINKIIQGWNNMWASKWLNIFILEWNISVTMPFRWDTERKENIWLCLYHPFGQNLSHFSLAVQYIHISQQVKFPAFTTSAMGKDWVICMYFLFCSQWRKSVKQAFPFTAGIISILWSCWLVIQMTIFYEWKCLVLKGPRLWEFLRCRHA